MQKLVFVNGAGNEIDLTSGNFGITNWSGLSNVPLNIQSQKVPFEDGSVFLDALINQRDIELTVAIEDNNNLELRYQKKRELISALNPKLGEGILTYTNDFLSKQIKVIPQIPLFPNKNSNDPGTLKATVLFTCCNPYWEDIEDTIVEINNENAEIVNEGDVPTSVKIEIDSGVNTPTIINKTQNKQITVNGVYEVPVVISTQTGSKSVIKKNKRWTWSGAGDFKTIVEFDDKILIGGIFNGDILMLNKNCEIEKIIVAEGVSSPIGNIFIARGYCYFVSQLGAHGNFRLTRTRDLINWERITTVPYTKLKFINNTFFSFGSNNVIATSKNLTDWQTINNNYGVVSDIEYTNNKYILTSDNGLYVGETLNKLIKIQNYIGDKIYCANNKTIVLGSGHIYTSSDLSTWSDIISDSTMNEIKFDPKNNKFIILTSNSKVKMSSDGLTWTDTTIQNAKDLKSILIRENDNILIGSYGTIVFNQNEEFETQYTVDFESYTGPDRNTINSLIKVNRNGVDEYYLSAYGKGIRKSFDKKIWFNVAPDILSAFRIIYEPSLGVFLALVTRSSNRIWRSVDGENWSAVYTGTFQAHGVCYDGSSFWVVGRDTTSSSVTKILRSSDGGLTWDTLTANQKLEYVDEIIFINGTYIIVGQYGICTSPDALNWTKVVDTSSSITSPTGAITEISNIKYIPFLNSVVAIGTSCVFISSDFINWTYVQVIGDFRGIGFNDEQIILVSNSNTVKTSFDGFNWHSIQIDVSSGGESVLYDNGEFLIGGCFLLSLVDSTDEDIISSISQDSDMSLGLNIGSNKIKLYSENGEIKVKISYRQKYIGV